MTYNQEVKSIAVIFGGRSAEHDVSTITAHIPIIESLLASGQFDVWPVYITKEGAWYSEKSMNNLTFFKDPDYEAHLKKQKQVQLSFENGFSLVWPGFLKKTVKIDVAFPSMHGTYGEDGSLMGLLRMANVPFVGCDIFGSAVAMDKVLTKQVIAAEGMPVVPYVWFTKPEWAKNKDALLTSIKNLKWPLFVKPVHLGSSIGMAKVKSGSELENAIEVALHYDNKILVEESVEPLIEITLPIMGNDEIRTAHCERPLNKTEFFDFSDKYLSGGKKGGGGGVNAEYSEIPAKISNELTAEIKDLGVRVYRALDLAGIARVDFLVHADSKKVYVNEVNTLPGSLYHHNWKKTGLSSMELVLELMRLGEERFEGKKKMTFSFTSDILKKVGGGKKQ
ncbi:MAG: D-alanine-D-alanine ligase [Parcubacteria group bacterium Gr01-1014_8]|nr:MAG: D-alanine-D-alanine ligase [Parcubacteria group bacterium Gr01-1014_8]